MKVATFLLKHSIAAAVVVGGSVGFVAVAYFGLLLWAVLTNGGLGGPLALPGMVLLTFVAAVGSVVMILLPVTASAEALRVRRGMNRFLEIPVATLVLIAYVAVALAGVASYRGWSVEGTARGGVALLVIQLLLLGVYWWALQATELVVSSARSAWRRFAHRKVAPASV